MQLKNKVAIITGSSRGVGRATALLFAKEGAKVVVNCKTQKKKAVEVVEIIGTRNALLAQADVSKEIEVKRLVRRALDRFGRIDILVNNAGKILRPGDWKCDVAGHA